MNGMKRMAAGILSAGVIAAYANQVHAEETTSASHQKNQLTLSAKNVPVGMARFVYDSGLAFKYPDAVRGSRILLCTPTTSDKTVPDADPVQLPDT